MKNHIFKILKRWTGVASNPIVRYLLKLKKWASASRSQAAALLIGVFCVLLTPYVSDFWTEWVTKKETEVIGDWSDKAARLVVVEKLLNHDWSEHSNICIEKDCHMILKRTFTSVSSDADYKMLVGVTNFGNGCRSCHSLVSIFQFKATSMGWDLVVSDIGKITYGSMNYTEEMEEDSITFKEVAKNKLGIFINEYINLTGGNHAYNVNGYIKVGNKYERFLSLMTNCDNSGTYENQTDLNADFEFIPTNVGLYKLKVDLSGMIKSKPYKNSYVFSFNGERYFSKIERFGCEKLFY